MAESLDDPLDSQARATRSAATSATQTRWAWSGVMP